MSKFGEHLIESSKEALSMVYKDRIKQLEGELAAEKALADGLFEACQGWVVMSYAMDAYRKARGL